MANGFKMGEAFVDIHAKTDGLDREVKQGVDRATRGADTQARTGGSGIGKSLMAGFAGGIAAVGVGGIFKSIIGGASDLQETINKSNVIFGQQAKAIEGWAGSAAKNVGLSKQAALEAAASFGNMFTQLGFSSQAAADMSTKVVQMSADLGSFNNLPTAQVADMISAALRGEYDSLQALIPNINAARVEQEAMAMTGKSNADALTAQDKAAATLAIVNRDGALAAGDFARTSDGLANQQKIATAQFQDAAAKLGTQLLPALTAVAGFITGTLVPNIGALTGFFWDNRHVIGVVAAGITAMLIPAMVGAGSTALVAGANIARGWLLAMGPFGLVTAGLTAIVAALVWAWQNSETFRNIVRGVMDAVGGAAQAVSRTFWSAVDSMGAAWGRLREMTADPVRFMVNTVWNNGILRAWNAVVGFFGGRPAGPIAIPFATGGRVPGAGDGDTVPAMLTPGEFVVRKGIAGPTMRFLEALNAGQAEAVQAAGGQFGRMQAFADGGVVGRGQAWARAQHGKPYIWGGVGPVGYDCSGFISAITNVLLGRNPHQRIGATGSMPWPGFTGGLNSLFGVGWFTGNPGHTAGTLGGANVESGGSPSMTKYVQNAVGATHRQFNRHMSLPFVGGQFVGGGGEGMSLAGFVKDTVRRITDPLINRMPTPPPEFAGIPRGMATSARDRMVDAALKAVGFDSGGMLPPGYTLAHNATGRPEAVFTPEQLGAMSARENVTINIQQTSGSPAETGRMVALALRTVG